MKKLSKTNRNNGLLKALDGAKGFVKDFDIKNSPLRNKRAKAWLKRIYSTPLDKYEQELEDFLSKGDYVSASKEELARTREIFKEAADNYFKLKRAGKLKLSA